MGDVNDLDRLFPPVDRGIIKRVSDGLDDPTPDAVATTLENLAEAGKLPEHDYHGMLEANREQSSDSKDKVDIEPDDPLDVPPDADPTSAENAKRGKRAQNWAKQHAIDKRARELALSGSIEEMVSLLNTVDRWANEALLDPDLNGLGGTRFKTALDTLADGIRGALDELAARGATDELDAARATVRDVRNKEMQRGLLREVRGYKRLATGSGGDFERAKAWALDEGLTPWRVLKRVDMARFEFDITYEQQEELERLAREWVEEYRTLTENDRAASHVE